MTGEAVLVGSIVAEVALVASFFAPRGSLYRRAVGFVLRVFAFALVSLLLLGLAVGTILPAWLWMQVFPTCEYDDRGRSAPRLSLSALFKAARDYWASMGAE